MIYEGDINKSTGKAEGYGTIIEGGNMAKLMMKDDKPHGAFKAYYEHDEDECCLRFGEFNEGHLQGKCTSYYRENTIFNEVWEDEDKKSSNDVT